MKLLERLKEMRNPFRPKSAPVLEETIQGKAKDNAPSRTEIENARVLLLSAMRQCSYARKVRSAWEQDNTFTARKEQLASCEEAIRLLKKVITEFEGLVKCESDHTKKTEYRSIVDECKACLTEMNALRPKLSDDIELQRPLEEKKRKREIRKRDEWLKKWNMAFRARVEGRLDAPELIEYEIRRWWGV